jgi:hypothetical protein
VEQQQGKGKQGGGKAGTPPQTAGGAPGSDAKDGKTAGQRTPGGSSGGSGKVGGDKAKAKQPQDDGDGGKQDTTKNGAGEKSDQDGSVGVTDPSVLPFTPDSSSENFPVDFSVEGFDPARAYKRGDPVPITISGTIKGHPFKKSVTAIFERKAGGGAISYLHLDTVVNIEGMGYKILTDINIATTRLP